MMIVCLDAILDVGEAERSANLIETAAAHAVLRLGTMRSNLSLPSPFNPLPDRNPQ